jgi:Ni/Co efflux regulator RcnB
VAVAQEHPVDAGHQEPEHTPEAHSGPVVHHGPVIKRPVVRETVTRHVDQRVVQRVTPPHAAGRWHAGDRFTGGRVVFTDYDRFHMRRPPPGYAWVQDGGELVLISLATGIISDIFVIPVP